MLLLFVGVLSLSSCDSVTVTEETGDVEFVLSGGIASEFSDGTPVYEGTVNFSRTGIANRLEVQLSVRCDGDDASEQARLAFRFAYASNSGELPPGEYSVVPDQFVPSIGEGSYEFSRGENEYARYGLTGSALRLEVEESEPGRLVARFALDLDQRTGERFEDGQSITVTLTSPVRALGSFDLPVEGLEFVDQGQA